MLAVISGFLQSGLMKVEQKTGIKIDGNDLFLLRWIADLRFKFPKKVIGEHEFFSISYDQMSEDLPFLRISKAEMYKCIARLSDAGYLTKNNSMRGQRAYYRLGESFTYLYYDEAPSANYSDASFLKNEEFSAAEIARSECEEWLDSAPSVLGLAENDCKFFAQKVYQIGDTFMKRLGMETLFAEKAFLNGDTFLKASQNGDTFSTKTGGANICTNSVRTLDPSNNNQPVKSQEITSVLRPTNNNQLSISQELSDTYPVEKDPKENIPYGDIKEKGKKRAPKGTEMFPILLPILDESTLASPLKEALRGWLEYKAERKEKYVPTGFKSLLTQAKKNAEKYGDDAVIDLIDECKANNYQGIIWDKLAKLPAKAQQPKLEAEHASVKRPDPEIEWRKSRFAPRDYRAGLRSISTSELREYPKNSGKYVPYWMIPGYMQEYPAGSGKYVPYYELPGYDPEHDENHWW